MLPVLAVLDVVSTLYIESLGYPLVWYEVGFFARFFVRAGLAYVYAVVYLLIIVCFACVLWFIKNRILKPSSSIDKALFMLLVGGICYMYMTLTATFIGNFSLPYALDNGIDLYALNILIYLGAGMSLFFYLFSDVVRWIRAKGEKK
jgi:hypothetical protein